MESTFIIVREDRAYDPKTVVGEGLRIGRLSESDVWLNHSAVSRLHAGINKVEDYYYLINLSASSATTLNGRAIPFNEAEALTDGDEIQIGPYFLTIEQTDDALKVTVVLQFALKVGDQVARDTSELSKKRSVVRKQSGDLAPRPLAVANALKVFWGGRTREKAGRPSPLHPRTPPRPGKIRFNWMPTRDLIRPWPFAIFIWAAIVVVALSTVAAFAYKKAFTPRPLSASHTRASSSVTPPIAKQPNGGSCSSCHPIEVSIANLDKMNANCAACHQTESFAASITKKHRDAGITCTTCHTEHRGESFRPLNAALESCTSCHSDDNKNLYQGKSVHTAHGGTYGYPVKDRVWIWTGLDEEERAAKPEVEEFLKQNRVDSSQEQAWRNAQFHGIHLNHIRVVAGLDGIVDDDGVTKVLSCSSCHKTGYMGQNVDRKNPIKACPLCHNDKVFNENPVSTTSGDTPSCTSCHVQHVKDTHWAPSIRLALSKNQAPGITK